MEQPVLLLEEAPPSCGGGSHQRCSHHRCIAGGIEAVTCLMAMRDGIIPPTINYETPDENCDLDYVTSGSRKAELNTVMSNSFGFGGTNGVLIFKKI